jgi:hypothetical protein
MSFLRDKWPVRRPLPYSENAAYYESAPAVHALGGWYDDAKERSFVDAIMTHAKLSPVGDGTIVELGGGTGQHGLILRDRFGDRYLFTDLSESFVAHARDLGLNARQLNALEVGAAGLRIDAVFCVGLSTLISEDNRLRTEQLGALQQSLVPGAKLIIVVPRFGRAGGMHTLARNEIESAGFRVRCWKTWGIVPQRVSRRLPAWLSSMLDAGAGTMGLGLRRLIVAEKKPGASLVFGS